jgi:radical SAM superfamily enzyme YgiQ (UPF0313 family)
MKIKQLRKKIASSDVVGISSYTPSFPSALNLTNIIKNVDPLKPIILGGYHASLLAEETIQRKTIDVVVRGEGEFTFRELVSYMDTNLDKKNWKDGLKDIKGIGYLKNGNPIITEKRPLVKNLDDLPFPARHLVKKNKYRYFGASIDAMETARGCPHNCNFCCVKPHWDYCWRSKSPERVLLEIASMRKDVRWHGFQDSEFTANMKRVEKIFDLIEEYGYSNKRWYSAQGRVDDVFRHPKIFEKMADRGFKFFFIGIESIFQKSLDAIGKHIKISQIKKAVKILHDNGIAIFGSIIIGNVNETWDEVLKTAEFARQLNIDIMQFTPLTPLPATPLLKEARERGWLEDEDYSHWNLIDPIMRTDNLTREQIKDAVALAYSRFYLGGRKQNRQSYLPRKSFDYFGNRKFWWFFHPKMGPRFILNTVPNMLRLINLIRPGMKREKQLAQVKKMQIIHEASKQANTVESEQIQEDSIQVVE